MPKWTGIQFQAGPWIDAPTRSRGQLSGAPHQSGKARLGFTYRIHYSLYSSQRCSWILTHLSGAIETDCSSCALYLASSTATRALPPPALSTSAAPTTTTWIPRYRANTPVDKTTGGHDINTQPDSQPLTASTPSPPLIACPGSILPSFANRLRLHNTWYTAAASVSACSCGRGFRVPMLKRRRSRARTLPPT